jgi:shikimate dehydrogenase
MSEIKLFAVTGNPILHSRSPEMFQAAFKALGLDNCYYLRFASSRAEEIVQAMRDIPVSGFNVTFPFQEKVVPLLDEVDETAQKIGAVNMIINEKDRLKGYNTDVMGMEEAFFKNGVIPAGKRAVVLGAGKAAKAAVVALTEAGTDVVIINRTLKKAKFLAETFSCRASSVEHLQKEIAEADILVSCLPADVNAGAFHSLRQGLVILDMNSGETTALVKEATHKGCTIIDGKEWLLFHGIKAFTYFTGMQPPLEAMRKALYERRAFNRRSVALIGFMGVGKSTIGHLVAKRLKIPLIDIDREIEKLHGMPIEEIFEKKGEEAFRRMEAKEIERVAGLSGRVISCGGGAVLNKDSMNYLRKHCIIVWLWADIDTILKRTGNSGVRPLLKVQDRRSRIETLLTFRKSYYADALDLFIRTDRKKPGEIAERIYSESAQFLKN